MTVSGSLQLSTSTPLRLSLTLHSIHGPSPDIRPPSFSSMSSRRKLRARKAHLEPQLQRPRSSLRHRTSHKSTLRMLPRVLHIHNLHQALHHRHLHADLPQRRPKIQHLRRWRLGHHFLDHVRLRHHLHLCPNPSSVGLQHHGREVHPHSRLFLYCGGREHCHRSPAVFPPTTHHLEVTDAKSAARGSVRYIRHGNIVRLLVLSLRFFQLTKAVPA